MYMKSSFPRVSEPLYWAPLRLRSPCSPPAWLCTQRTAINTGEGLLVLWTCEAIRSRQKWMEEGEKNTKYFFNLEKRNNTTTAIMKLKVNDNISDNFKEISSYVTKFYSKLYSARSDIDQSSAFLADIRLNARYICENSKDFCDREIYVGEIKTSITKLKDNKAPGNDGLTGEFYKEFMDLTSEFLLAVFKEAFEKGVLPSSMTQGLITLIPKQNKDSLLLDNWRPITLINNDAKILALIFAQRMKKCLHEIIDDSQSGFLKDRHISNNIRLVLDLIDYKDLLDDEPMICFIDYYKAFDTVEHSFIFDLLNFFGFGSYFIHAIHVMYTNCNSSIKLFNGTSERFNINRGIKQGDPVAPYIFLIVIQALCLHINNNNFKGICIGGNEIKCSQLADDTTIFLQNEEQIPKAIECLQTFSDVSGLCVNIKKCELFSLKGNILEGTIFYGIPVKETVTYLGINICKNPQKRVELNFQPLVNKVKNRFNLWLARDLSIYGRILLSKGEGLSRFTYPAMVLDVPNKTLKDMDRNLLNFVWRHKRHYLKKDVLCNSTQEGGLDMLNFGTSNTTLKIKWIRNYFLNQNKLWNYIPNMVFEKVGGLKFLLKCNFHISNLPIFLSSFHKQVLLSWINVYKHNFSLHRCYIWNNKFVKYRNKSFFLTKWVDQKVLLIRQLLNDHGNLYTYSELIQKYNLDVTEPEYIRVRNATPAGIIALLQSSANSEPRDVDSYPLLDGIEIINKRCNNRHVREISQTKAQFIAKHRWNAIFTDINWNKVFVQSKNYCLTNKIREVSFKIVHRIYPCKILLKKMKRETDELCTFCKISEESLCHLFFDCNFSRSLWHEIESIFNKAVQVKISLDKKDILFIYEEKTPKLDNSKLYIMNLFIIQAKYYIHKCKWANKIPSIKEFITEIDRYFCTISGMHNKKAEKTIKSLLATFNEPLLSYI